MRERESERANVVVSSVEKACCALSLNAPHSCVCRPRMWARAMDSAGSSCAKEACDLV